MISIKVSAEMLAIFLKSNYIHCVQENGNAAHAV